MTTHSRFDSRSPRSPRLPRLALALFALFAVAASVVACSSSQALPPSGFDAQSSAERCNGPIVTDMPAATPVTARAIPFHVTNRSSQARWVQTAGDEGCSPFDVLRGGAPIPITPTRVCGCDCKAAEPRAVVYKRLAPGEALDLSWDGIAQQQSLLCVTGEKFGCADGQVLSMPTSTPYVANALHYDIAIHVETAAPAGCTEQPDGSWQCGGEGIAPGTTCVHGLGKMSALLSLDADAGSPKLDFDLQ